ncbi:hypothetical protein [Mycoplasma bradburyae]|uniref:Uncharacterized protein n=1 Tax=Mycoplasma bradburyae TaxID=2963128 RepID=A0AAW6HMQ6_9MOLU|nr:hypothetical protein [Mycoplasma bradburyae]MDC4183142.1 hypothetical protein [Mycoplasma bradburyae]UTS70542.1 hypothetical protein NMG77_02195 [Mycoplasma bradburyae]
MYRNNINRFYTNDLAVISNELKSWYILSNSNSVNTIRNNDDNLETIGNVIHRVKNNSESLSFILV